MSNKISRLIRAVSPIVIDFNNSIASSVFDRFKYTCANTKRTDVFVGASSLRDSRIDAASSFSPNIFRTVAKLNRASKNCGWILNAFSKCFLAVSGCFFLIFKAPRKLRTCGFSGSVPLSSFAICSAFSTSLFSRKIMPWANLKLFSP